MTGSRLKHPSIRLKRVYKEYRLKKLKSGKKLVLNGVDWEIFQGEKIGLIGPNGSGKSTLLKLIAGITKPTAGSIHTYGRVASLMNLEDGFDLNLSGRENILLNGMLVGMTKQEVREKTDRILDFAGIGEYIDAPFYTYSSGMKFRLAFAVAIASDYEILLMDEIFLVGDSSYQTKMLRELQNIKTARKDLTLMISIHDPIFLLNLVDSCYKIEQGKLVKVDMEEVKRMSIRRDQEYHDILF